MGKFCKYCGSELVDGKCTCDLYIQNNPDTIVEKPMEQEASESAETQDISEAQTTPEAQAASEVQQTEQLYDGQPNGAPQYNQGVQPNGAPQYNQGVQPNGAPQYNQGVQPNGAPQYNQGVQPNGAPQYNQGGQQYGGPQYNQGGQPYGGQPNYYQQAAKEQFNNSKMLFMKFLKNPLGMMSEVVGSSDKTSPFIFGGIHLLLILLFTFIRVPKNEFLGITMATKFSLGLKLAIFIAIVILVTASATFVLGKITKTEMAYPDVLRIFCLTTIPSSMIIILWFLLSYLSSVLATVAIIMALTSWVILVNEAIQVCVKKSKNLCFWFTIVTIAAVMLITSIICQIVLKSYVSELSGSLLRGLFY